MGVSRVTLRLLEVSVLLPPSGLKSFLMVSSEDSTKLSTLPRKRLSPSTLPDITLTPRIRNTSTETWRESRNTAQLLELSPPLKLRSVSSDKRSATLWKFKLTVVSLLPRRLIGLSPSSSLRLPSLKFSKRTRWLTLLPSLVVTELRVSSEELVYPDFLENLTEVFVKSDVLVLGIHLLLSGPLLVLVTSVITTEPNLTRRSITSVKVQLETLTTTLPLRLIPMPRTLPQLVDSPTTVLSMKTSSSSEVVLWALERDKSPLESLSSSLTSLSTTLSLRSNSLILLPRLVTVNSKLLPRRTSSWVSPPRRNEALKLEY